MVQAIDNANDNTAARSIYRRLYLSLSHFTVHASGGTLLRHVSTRGKLLRRPAKAWTRRSPARVIDAATGTLAADLARHAGRPDARLAQYASKHEARTIMPVVVMAFNGTGGSSSSPLSRKRIVEAARIIKEVYVYLWNGPAAADPVAGRAAFVRKRFAAIMASDDREIPPAAFDPLIEHVATMLAQLQSAPESGSPASLAAGRRGPITECDRILKILATPSADYSPMRRRVRSADLAAQNRQFCAAYRLIPNAADSYAC